MNLHKKFKDGELIDWRINGVSQLGDRIATVADPIAVVLDKTLGTKISGCGGCGKMKERLNAGMSLTEAAILRWHGK